MKLDHVTIQSCGADSTSATYKDRLQLAYETAHAMADYLGHQMGIEIAVKPLPWNGRVGYTDLDDGFMLVANDADIPNKIESDFIRYLVTTAHNNATSSVSDTTGELTMTTTTRHYQNRETEYMAKSQVLADLLSKYLYDDEDFPAPTFSCVESLAYDMRDYVRDVITEDGMRSGLAVDLALSALDRVDWITLAEQWADEYPSLMRDVIYRDDNGKEMTPDTNSGSTSDTTGEKP